MTRYSDADFQYFLQTLMDERRAELYVLRDRGNLRFGLFEYHERIMPACLSIMRRFNDEERRRRAAKTAESIRDFVLRDQNNFFRTRDTEPIRRDVSTRYLGPVFVSHIKFAAFCMDFHCSAFPFSGVNHFENPPRRETKYEINERVLEEGKHQSARAQQLVKTMAKKPERQNKAKFAVPKKCFSSNKQKR